MVSLLSKIFFFALLLATAPLTTAQSQDDNAYTLRLVSSLGEPRVQAIAGQLPLMAQVKPRLAKNHILKIETEAGQSSAAQSGETILKDVPRGLHTFYLVVKDQNTGQEISRSPPLTLDVRRFISRQ